MKAITDITKLVEVGDDGIDVDPSASSSILSRALSPSTMTAMSDCHARYAVDKLLYSFIQASAPATVPNKIGTTVHAVLEQLMSGADRSPARIDEILANLMAHDKVEYPTDDEELGEWEKSVIKLSNGLYKIENPDDVDVVSVEQRVQVTLWDVPINGFVDRVDRHDDGLFIVDYKSGKAPRSFDNFNRQITVYAQAIEAICGEPVVGGSDYFLATGKAHTVPMSRQHVSLTRRAVKEAWTQVEALRDTMHFGYQTSALCGWCPLVTQCPAAKANGFVPKTPEASILQDVNFNSNHVQPITQAVAERTDTVSTEEKPYVEDKKWVPLLPNGEVNLGSYDADNASRVAKLAIYVAESHCVDEPTNKDLVMLGKLFQSVISRGVTEAVQATNTIPMGSSIWSTAFYIFNSWIAKHPVNFSDVETWADEAVVAIRKTIRLTKKLLVDSYDDDPFDISTVDFGGNRWQ